MSVTIIANERPKARKHHTCSNCQCSIAPGEVYSRQRNIYDGVPYVWKSHLDCAALAYEIWSLRGAFDDGIPPLYDEERQHLEEWRGSFPHAVCRTELGWEQARARAIMEGK